MMKVVHVDGSVLLYVHRNRKRKRGKGVWRRGEEGDYYTYRYTVTTRMTPALRWAVMRAILMFH